LKGSSNCFLVLNGFEEVTIFNSLHSTFLWRLKNTSILMVSILTPKGNALKYEPDSDPNNASGLRNGILVHDRDTGFPLHVLPNQHLFLKGDTKRYFPKNTYQEDKTERVIGSSFAGAYTHKNARLNKAKTKASHHNMHGVQFPTRAVRLRMLMMAPLGSLSIHSRIRLVAHGAVTIKDSNGPQKK